MFQQLIIVLSWFGICVFALSGALVASRKEMDIVEFAMFGTVTGIGGGTIRDVVLGARPVFRVKEPAYLATCVAVATLIFFIAHILQSRERLLLWFDAVGLALFSVTSVDSSLMLGASPIVAVALGVSTATFGGILRDILGGEGPITLNQEVYITGALLSSAVFVLLIGTGMVRAGGWRRGRAFRA